MNEESKTTWKNNVNIPKNKNVILTPTTHRNRLQNPNHLPYGAGHSAFYKLPYETKDELNYIRARTTHLPTIHEESEEKTGNPLQTSVNSIKPNSFSTLKRSFSSMSDLSSLGNESDINYSAPQDTQAGRIKRARTLSSETTTIQK